MWPFPVRVRARPRDGGVIEGMPQQPDKRRHKGTSLFWTGHAIVSPSASSRRNLIFPSFPQTAAQLRKRENVKNKFQRGRKPVICRNIRALFELRLFCLEIRKVAAALLQRSDTPDAYLTLPDQRHFCLRLKLHRRPVTLMFGNRKRKTLKICWLFLFSALHASAASSLPLTPPDPPDPPDPAFPIM